MNWTEDEHGRCTLQQDPRWVVNSHLMYLKQKTRRNKITLYLPSIEMTHQTGHRLTPPPRLVALRRLTVMVGRGRGERLRVDGHAIQADGEVSHHVRLVSVRTQL